MAPETKTEGPQKVKAGASKTAPEVSDRGMERYKGGVALVTGASSGIGAAICRELVKHEMIVVGCAREVDRVQSIADEPEVKEATGELCPVKCDLADKEEIATLFKLIKKKYGKINVCINNAGFATDTPLRDGETEKWKDMLKVDILALCICTRESIQLMQEAKVKNGLIIQVGCVMGHRVPEIPVGSKNPPNFGFYYGMKFMVRGLAESLRHELRRNQSDVRVALISPGCVNTEMYGRGHDKAAAASFYGEVNCLIPDDIAAAVRYIMRQRSNVNVQDIIVQPSAYSLTS